MVREQLIKPLLHMQATLHNGVLYSKGCHIVSVTQHLEMQKAQTVFLVGKMLIFNLLLYKDVPKQNQTEKFKSQHAQKVM